jgi:hypothetical protein
MVKADGVWQSAGIDGTCSTVGSMMIDDDDMVVLAVLLLEEDGM